MPAPKPLLRFRRRSPFILLMLLILWSFSIGWALSQAAQSQIPPNPPAIGTVDPTPAAYQVGEQLYVEHCGSCHVALPPAVLPTTTWRDLLLDEEHYGTRIEVMMSPQIYIVWDYLEVFSRPTDEGEETPYRLDQSRYFKALHPDVQIDRPVTIQSCTACHPQAPEFDFRSLSAEWQS